ncbi:MAG: glycosyltransferase, partial [Acidimicrobiia bacterium]
MTAESTEPKVAVVIPTYNRPELLQRTLAALGAQDYPTGQIAVVVADDGSEEDVRAVFEQWDPPFAKHYLRQDHDGFGAGRARNMGASSIAGDVVVFLDSDAIVRPDFVRRHAAWHVANDNLVVIGGRTQLKGADLDSEALARGSVDLGEATAPNERNDFRSVLSRRTSGFESTDEGYRALVSSNVSLSSRLFAVSGGFDPRFRRWSGEDTELGWRLWQAGARFIDDSENLIFHQIDADTAGGIEGRQQARELNMGLLVSLIPQRFYRKGMPEPPPEVPKFSVVVHDLTSGAPRAIWRAMLNQTLPDFELIFVAEPQDHDPFAGAAEGERRIHFAGDADLAVSMSRGEYLVFFDGHGAPSRTLLQNLRKRLDQRPASVGMTFGIQTPEGPHNRLIDIADLETSWDAGLPLAMAVRRRPLIQLLNSGDDLAGALTTMRESDAMMHQSLTLAALPGAEPSSRPEAFTFDPAPRAQMKEAVRLGVGPTLRVGARLARRRLRPAAPEKGPSDRQPPEGKKPGIRYVGWVGKDNLGDEAMLEATATLLNWGDLDVRGEASDLLLLGGGT